jgi:hypothetical protein
MRSTDPGSTARPLRSGQPWGASFKPAGAFLDALRARRRPPEYEPPDDRHRREDRNHPDRPATSRRQHEPPRVALPPRDHPRPGLDPATADLHLPDRARRGTHPARQRGQGLVSLVEPVLPVRRRHPRRARRRDRARLQSRRIDPARTSRPSSCPTFTTTPPTGLSHFQSTDIIVTKENYQASTGFNSALLGAVPSQSPARFAPARPTSPAAGTATSGPWQFSAASATGRAGRSTKAQNTQIGHSV